MHLCTYVVCPNIHVLFTPGISTLNAGGVGAWGCFVCVARSIKTKTKTQRFISNDTDICVGLEISRWSDLKLSNVDSLPAPFRNIECGNKFGPEDPTKGPANPINVRPTIRRWMRWIPTCFGHPLCECFAPNIHGIRWPDGDSSFRAKKTRRLMCYQ